MQKLILIAIGCCIALILVAGCTDSSSSSPATPTPYPGVKTTTVKPTIVKTTVASQEEGLTLVEDHSDKASGYIEGTVKSNVGKTLSYVQVTINLYDASGAQIGSTLANTNNLEPYGTWKFKAPVVYKDTASYKIMEIKGF